MKRIKMTKTTRSNAVVSTVAIFDDGQVMAVDSSDKDWRTNSNHTRDVDRAINWMSMRGYKYVIADDGSHKRISELRSSTIQLPSQF